MQTASQIAVVGYRQVLEDGPEVCDSESGSEHSDHGEMWTDADMYTRELLGADGKKLSGFPQISQAELPPMLVLSPAEQRARRQHLAKGRELGIRGSGLAANQATRLASLRADPVQSSTPLGADQVNVIIYTSHSSPRY
jgi:hypothetical protein